MKNLLSIILALVSLSFSAIAADPPWGAPWVTGPLPILSGGAGGIATNINLAPGTGVTITTNIAGELWTINATAGSGQTNIAVAGVTNAGTAAYSNATAFVLEAAASRMSTNLQSFIIPQQFGAVGDGTTDDSGAMLKWLNFAAVSNLVALLPPAPGGFYKITQRLIVTNQTAAYGFHIVGCGGPFHVSDAAKHACAIKQFTAGADGIAITNDASGIVIEGIRVLANTYDPTSRGIVFDGTVSDSDCSVIRQCGVEGFGKGIFLASVADTIIDVCSVGLCGEGLFMGAGTYSDGSVLNNIAVRNGQFSYSYSNNISCIKGNLSITDTDVAQVDDQGLGKALNSHGIFIGAGGQVTMRNCRLENDITSGSAQPSIVSSNGGYLFMYNCGSSIAGGAGATSYTMALTNITAFLYSCTFNEVANDGYPILENMGNLVSGVHSDQGWPIKYILGPNITTSIMTPGIVQANSTLSAQSFGQQVVQMHGQYVDNLNQPGGGYDDNTALLMGVKFSPYRSTAAVIDVDLLQYAKDRIACIPGYNIIATNNITATNKILLGTANVTLSTGTGSPEGVLTAPTGSLYFNVSGGASTTLYVKTSGSGNTGWTAK